MTVRPIVFRCIAAAAAIADRAPTWPAPQPMSDDSGDAPRGE